MRDHSARLQPSLVLVGNDRRAEFYAALDGHPRALGGYIDDGLFSYVSRPGSSRTRWTNRIAQWSRRAVYGFAVEKPWFVGGSRAVREAWVMLPYQVHEGLDGKHVRRLRPEWFRLPAARAVYAQAMASAGVDAAQIARARLLVLVLLPHDAFLREHPELLDALARAVRRHREAGHEVALKRHPRSEAGILPPQLSTCVEIPRRIPVEILAPFLDDAEIVGSLTSAMITLVKLGANVRARSLAPVSASHGRMGEVYRAAGIGPLQPAALSYLL